MAARYRLRCDLWKRRTGWSGEARSITERREGRYDQWLLLNHAAAGHVSCMNHAAELGDRLIVAVNTDEDLLSGVWKAWSSCELIVVWRYWRAWAQLTGWCLSPGSYLNVWSLKYYTKRILVKGGDYKPEEIAGGAESDCCWWWS